MSRIEYKSHKHKQDIIFKYRKNKLNFTNRFNCNDTDYDICFNVYGRLMNKPYFEEIKKVLINNIKKNKISLLYLENTKE